MFLLVSPPPLLSPRQLTMLSLRVNKLSGALPSDWDTPLLEMLLLNDNQLTGEDHADASDSDACNQ